MHQVCILVLLMHSYRLLSTAAVAALDIHPGVINEQLAVIFAIAAAEILRAMRQLFVLKFKFIRLDFSSPESGSIPLTGLKKLGI